MATTPSTGVDVSKGSLGLNLLHSPACPVVDFVFVHGLGGGSRKTWSRTSSIEDYWPQEWLPKDPDFKHVRVHSFGYNSDWGKGKDNCLNIHHFAKSLLGELITSPVLGNGNTQIVFIGHSMGGLVIKKAYILAKQDPSYAALTDRFHAMYFFATPHLGSDSARHLNNILQVAYSSRGYVADVKRGSKAIQSINNDFRKYAPDLDLWSFYETHKMSLGVFNVLIVDPDSAILGYPEEKQIPMNADHRSICKFLAPTDSNYVTARNALASTVNDISQLAKKSKNSLRRVHLNAIGKYLGVSEPLDDDLITAEDARAPGTCEWFTNKGIYLSWSNFAAHSPRVLWLHGPAASGKSVLAASVIGKLRQMRLNCSYFFFKYGDETKSQLSACLRSLAYQMASTDARIRATLAEMQEDDMKFDYENERIIWRKILSGAFDGGLSEHYWVIDALDECANPAPFIDLMLAKLDKSTPLRVLVISRETSDLRNQFLTLGVHECQSEAIATTDTLADIEALVSTKTPSLVVEDQVRGALVNEILRKSKGSFLWTALVLNELSTAHSQNEIDKVLEDVPRGMVPLYNRALESMSRSLRTIRPAKAILTWTTCAMRPLKTEELERALELDINDTFPKLDESIMAFCGQLVTVDRFGKVQMVHETAREFLLRENLESEFAINSEQAHTRIAKACLTYMTGDEMKPPRAGRRSRITSEGSPFFAYACTAFSYHLAKTDSLSNDILFLVGKFLKCNILSWIEFIAQTQNLLPLIQAAKHLRMYHNSCTAVRSPLASNLQIVKGWATDLVRIAAKFADALVVSPSAIYSLIPPFCPGGSAAFNTVKPGRRLSVVGISNPQWDDRLACVDFHRGQATAICHGDEHFAVGLSTGVVILYHSTTCQEFKTLDHGEAIIHLQFKSKSDILVSCGLRSLRVWNIHTGQTVYCFQAPRRPLSLAFHKTTVIAACSKNYLASWNLDDGSRQPDRPWDDRTQHTNSLPLRVPSAISISVGHQMLAAAYSGRPIILWDLEEDSYYGSCGKKLSDGRTSTHAITALVFNPNPSIGVIAASYLDGELVLLDPFDDRVLASSRANCHTIAASPDGRLLAGGAGFGTIHIYEFDTLRLLYRVKSSSIYIKQLAFSKDGLHFLDIRASQCNVWEPAALVRDLVSDASSESMSTSLVEAASTDTKIKISAMAVHHQGPAVFCGKDDGSISLYDLRTAAHIRTLYRHDSQVRTVSLLPQREIIISVDASNGIYAWDLTRAEGRCMTDKMRFQSRLDCGMAISQVLPGDTPGKFILSTRDSDHLWNLDGREEESRKYLHAVEGRQWIEHPQSPAHMICVEGTVARVYDWEDFTEVGSVFLGHNAPGLQLRNAIPYAADDKQRLFLRFSGCKDSHTHAFCVTDTSVLKTWEKPNQAVPGTSDDRQTVRASPTSDGNKTADTSSASFFCETASNFGQRIAHIIGIGNSRLVFLDTTSWVCSVEVDALRNGPESYTRHFFVPYEWLAGKKDAISAVVERDILLARNDEVAIIKGGLEFAEEALI
ncbi:WD40 [Aspergillus sp. HF37]|nr:WD40 [Aspergillus sp. HF37]